MPTATCSSSPAAISRASSTSPTTGRNPSSRSSTHRKGSLCAARTRRSITAQPPRWTSISAPAASHFFRRIWPWSAASKETSTCWTVATCRASSIVDPHAAPTHATDASLLAPEPQPHLGKRGPLNVFGPYSDMYGAMDLARGRSVPAMFRDAQGAIHVIVTGNTKKDAASTANVAPSLARLKVDDGRTPCLARAGAARENARAREPRLADRHQQRLARSGRVGAGPECAPFGAARRRRRAATGSLCVRCNDAAAAVERARRDSCMRAANTTSR